MPRKTTTSQKKTVDRALRAGIREGRSELANGAGAVSEMAERHAGAAIQSAGGLAERTLHMAEETVDGLAADAEDWSSSNLDSARKSVRTQPLAAIALAFGAGAVLGVFFLRR